MNVQITVTSRFRNVRAAGIAHMWQAIVEFDVHEAGKNASLSCSLCVNAFWQQGSSRHFSSIQEYVAPHQAMCDMCWACSLTP